MGVFGLKGLLICSIITWIGTELYALIRFDKSSLIFGVRKLRYPWERKKPLFIGTLPITSAIIKTWVKKDTKIFFAIKLRALFKKLQKGVEYETETHDLLKEGLMLLAEKGRVKIIGVKKIGRRSLLKEKLMLRNFHNLSEKVQFYRIIFVKL